MQNDSRIKVWDPLVRIFHWTLVASFATAWVSAEEFERLHANAGYLILLLIAIRAMWGLIGTRHARFTDFVYPASEVRRYTGSLLRGRPHHYVGHNPLGGWMVVALLVGVLATATSGILAEPPGTVAFDFTAISAAQANGDDDQEREGGSEFWEEVHEAVANLTGLLVLLHIAGAIVASLLHRENLIWAMVTGFKRDHHTPPT
jgi:cytochrome b